MGGGSEKFTILKKQRQLRCDCYWFKTGSQSSHPVQSNRKSSTKIPTHSNPWLDPIHVHLWYTQLNKLKQFNISNTASCPDSTWPRGLLRQWARNRGGLILRRRTAAAANIAIFTPPGDDRTKLSALIMRRS